MGMSCHPWFSLRPGLLRYPLDVKVNPEYIFQQVASLRRGVQQVREEEELDIRDSISCRNPREFVNFVGRFAY